MDYNNGTIIGEVEKNKQEKYIVAAKEYKGYKFVDVRMYYKHEDRWLPTKKGITISPKNAESMMSAINKGLCVINEVKQDKA
tara:strand:+ start:187 stop:432 length:246 start_codon:yes stop_codon:yes gene_type:complete